jgi:tubulin alpha
MSPTKLASLQGILATAVQPLHNKMKELISIHVGAAGVQLGNACWDLFCLEHGVLSDGSLASSSIGGEGQEALRSVFSVSAAAKCSPRAVYVDTDPTVINEVRTGATQDLFQSENLIAGKGDASRNFGLGRYILSGDVLDLTLERIRKLAEDCNDLQGFLIFNSVSGGTGSGLGSQIVQRLNADYGGKTMLGFPIFPSPQTSTSIAEHYNTVLGTKYLKDYLDLAVILENQALHDINRHKLGIDDPSLTNLNHLAAKVISSVTASLRFGASMNRDLRELQVNVVPRPSLKFLLSSYAPLVSTERGVHLQPTVDEITNSALQPDSMLVKCGYNQVNYASCSLMYRGDVPPKEVESAVAGAKANMTVKMADWATTGIISGVVRQVPGAELSSERRTVGMISSNSAVIETFDRISKKFDLLYAKRAYVHHFVQEGMEESEFSEAREDLIPLVGDYESIGPYQYSRPAEEE